MAKKHESDWNRAAEAITTVVHEFEAVPGVISIHSQYAEPLAILVVLVETDAAKNAIREAECRLFNRESDLPVDVHVQVLPQEDIRLEQEALASAYGLLWSRN